jgi:hypothetical protein
VLKPTFLAAGLVAFSTAGILPASAEFLRFKADLSGEAQVPPVKTSASGSAAITYDTASHVVSWTVNYGGLSGPVTAAHFHGPADPDKNASPVVVFGPTLTSPFSGSSTVTEAQARELTSGRWYVNIHTAANPGGEIRGQVVKAP